MKRNLKKVLSDILFRNTGSTTSILEAITNKKVEVEIIQERIICDRDYSIRYNWGDSLILRATTLKAGGIVISNNIVIYDADKVNQTGRISRGRFSAARLYWGTRVRSMPKKSMCWPNSVMVAT